MCLNLSETPREVQNNFFTILGQPSGSDPGKGGLNQSHALRLGHMECLTFMQLIHQLTVQIQPILPTETKLRRKKLMVLCWKV